MTTLNIILSNINLINMKNSSPTTLKLVVFLLLSITNFSSANLIAQNISGTTKVAGYTLSYQFTPIMGEKYSFTVKNIENADTDYAAFTLAYSSEAQLIKEGNKITETRIYAASRNGAMWTVSLTEGLRLLYDYQTETISSQTTGTTLQKYETNNEAKGAKKLQFSKDKLQETTALHTIAQQFITRYYKIFGIGKSLKTVENATISGKVQAQFQGQKETYSYEVFSSDFGQELSIRHATKGLVYKTTLQSNKDKQPTITILYAKRKDVSWDIYSSDSWQMTFDKNTGRSLATKSGLFFAPIPENFKTITFKTNATETEIVKIAIEVFIKSYPQLF